MSKQRDELHAAGRQTHRIEFSAKNTNEQNIHQDLRTNRTRDQINFRLQEKPCWRREIRSMTVAGWGREQCTFSQTHILEYE